MKEKTLEKRNLVSGTLAGLIAGSFRIHSGEAGRPVSGRFFPITDPL